MQTIKPLEIPKMKNFIGRKLELQQLHKIS